MFLAFFFAKLMWFLAEFKIYGTFNMDVFIGDFEILSDQYALYNKLGYVSYTFTCIFASFFLEKLYKRTRYVVTVLNIISATLLIILPFGSGDLVFIGSLFLNSGLLLFISYNITKRSQQELRSLSSFLIFGMIFIVFGMLLGNQNVKEYELIPLWVSPSFTIGGIMIAVAPMIVNPDNYEKYNKFWVMIGLFLVITSWCLVFILCLTGGINEFMGVFMAANFFITLIFFSLIKILKGEDISSEATLPLDILDVFKKPRRISEEEVSISKERKICLVCKSKVGGIIYMCHECEAFYCKKCADSLVKIENMCWNCEAPIEKSKPVTKYEDLVKQEELSKGKQKLKKKPSQKEE